MSEELVRVKEALLSNVGRDREVWADIERRHRENIARELRNGRRVIPCICDLCLEDALALRRPRHSKFVPGAGIR